MSTLKAGKWDFGTILSTRLHTLKLQDGTKRRWILASSHLVNISVLLPSLPQSKSITRRYFGLIWKQRPEHNMSQECGQRQCLNYSGCWWNCPVSVDDLAAYYRPCLDLCCQLRRRLQSCKVFPIIGNAFNIMGKA